MKQSKHTVKKCGYCNRNTLLPYEYEFSQKHELSEFQGKKRNFINSLKYTELKVFCTCIDVYKLYEGDRFDKLYEALSNLRRKNF